MKKLIPIILIIALGFASCSSDHGPLTQTEFYLGTVVTITIYDSNAEQLMEGAMAEIERLESLLSGTLENSDISKINATAGLSGVEVADEVIEVIEKGLGYYNTSSGSFDISIGPLVELWGIGTPEAAVPSEIDITKAISNIDINGILIEDNYVSLLNRGMKLDTGGIAKGYIADKVADYLKANGCDAAVLNLGGNVVTVGQKPDGSKWRVGIQNPFESTGNYIRVVEVEEMSVVTSGSYERFFVEDGITYHHILDPETGYPVESDIAGVSIISSKSVDGDGLSTSVFALGSEKGMALIELIPGVECIMILEDGAVKYSSGIGEFLD